MSYYYTRDHEWISVNGTSHDTTATVGITDYAQAQLGDIVFVEAPPAGTQLDRGKECAVVESVKAASDIFAPVSGTVVEPNAALGSEPALVNTHPESDGWFFRMILTDSTQLEGLMDEHEYKTYVASL